MSRIIGCGLMLLLAAGCTVPSYAPDRPEPPPADAFAAVDLDPRLLDYRRDYERASSEAPFERGAMAVVAPDGGTLRTWRLVPCQGGQAVCAWSESGPAGRLSRTPDYVVVSGLFGVTFWLSYAGDGYVERDHAFTPLTWNSRIDGGEGSQAALETVAAHR